jgi:hypothetical protein
MKDLPDNKIDEAKDLVKNLDPDKTIFFFDNRYHAVKNDRLTEIPADEAEKSLKDPEFDLLNLGSPPGILPESCPSWIYTNIFMNGPVGEFLQMLFNAKYYSNLVNMSNDETISKS